MGYLVCPIRPAVTIFIYSKIRKYDRLGDAFFFFFELKLIAFICIMSLGVAIVSTTLNLPMAMREFIFPLIFCFRVIGPSMISTLLIPSKIKANTNAETADEALHGLDD